MSIDLTRWYRLYEEVRRVADVIDKIREALEEEAPPEQDDATAPAKTNKHLTAPAATGVCPRCRNHAPVCRYHQVGGTCPNSTLTEPQYDLGHTAGYLKGYEAGLRERDSR